LKTTTDNRADDTADDRLWTKIKLRIIKNDYTIYEACPIYGLVFLGAQNTLKLTEQGVVLETTPPTPKNRV
jgi:hypothetical protein